jgi:predicted Zn-dependent protease
MTRPWFALALATFVLVGCGVRVQGIDLGRVAEIGKRAVQSSDTITVGEEQQIGARMAAVLLGAAPLMDDSSTQRYVNSVGTWVAMHGERHNLSWRFAVLDSPNINAFAAPGGYVFITRGLMEMLDDEDELAAVLAHEISHVNHKHHLKALDDTKGLDLASQVALLAGDVYNASHSGNISRRTIKNQTVAKSLLAATQTLYVKGLSREDELDADRTGLVLMAKAGYDPYAMLAVLQKLQAQGHDASTLALYLSTHPDPEDRIEQVQSVVQRLVTGRPES